MSSEIDGLDWAISSVKVRHLLTLPLQAITLCHGNTSIFLKCEEISTSVISNLNSC